ncbi:GyrI-like domain-containing protein [Lewinella sp. W8]|uniref:GyrI-like domain-containing protein n=1 Tax=Lewinella sp. W8 TaxID=2528208 RepID=UPI001566C392|nr:GyrI-like domain-containing protein [Lewinella sp. W8]
MRKVFWIVSLLGGLLSGCTGDQAPKEEILSVEETGGEEQTNTLELNYEEVMLPERHYLVFQQELSLLDMEGFLAEESSALRQAARAAGVAPLGPPTSLFYKWDTDTGRGEAAVALPVTAETKLPPYVTISLPATKALSLEFAGSYDRLSAMHFALDAEMQRRGYRAQMPSIEEYPVGPQDSVEEAEFRTRILYPIQAPVE